MAERRDDPAAGENGRPATERRLWMVIGLAVALGTVGGAYLLRGDDACASTAGALSQTREGLRLAKTGNVTINRDGAVVSGLDVAGRVFINADDVTLTASTIHYGGKYAIQIADGVRGTLIDRTEVWCTSRQTSGVAFGNYVAQQVNLYSCGQGFRTDSGPATLRTSSFNGTMLPDGVVGKKPAPRPTSASPPRPEPTTEPPSAPRSTSAPQPSPPRRSSASPTPPSPSPTRSPTPTPSASASPSATAGESSAAPSESPRVGGEAFSPRGVATESCLGACEPCAPPRDDAVRHVSADVWARDDEAREQLLAIK